MKSKKNKTSEVIEKFLKNYFTLLGVDVDYDLAEDPDGVVSVNIITKEGVAGLLIGNKGRNLYALQSIVNSIVKKEDASKKIIVDVDGWREKDNLRLKDLADKTASKVVETGETQTLYNLTPSQRRIVHTSLSENATIKTESFGEGEERYLVVSPVKPQKK